MSKHSQVHVMSYSSTETQSSPSRIEVIVFSGLYDSYNEEVEFFKNNTERRQFMIVNSGCPRGLLGWKEFDRLKQEYEYKMIN